MAATALSDGLAEHLAGMINLPDSLEALKTKYQAAKPFPHLELQGLFAKKFLQEVSAEIPPLGDAAWVHHKDDHQNKFGLRSAVTLGEKGSALASILHSPSFLYFLSEVSGIWGLLPDPYLQGAGYHILPRGAKFDIHIDRKTDYVTGLRRRLALIVYLNDDWKPEYGGQLELWDKTGTKCEVVVQPNINTTILFEVADGNYHGNPNEIACPPGRSRNSFIVYYHTVPSDKEANKDVLSSVFAPTFYKRKFRMRVFLRDLIPPLIYRAIKKNTNKA